MESSRAELWMVVFHQDETIKVENEGTWCLSPVTGVYRKFSQRTECEPVEAVLMVRE
nr:MAG TPA: Late embryogenesis abundant protein [Caudoviricetes sp.]